MDGKFIIKVLWKKKWLLIILPLLTSFAVFFMFHSKPKQYQSTATVSFEPSGVDGQELKPDELVRSAQKIKSQRVLSALSFRLLLNDLENPHTKYSKTGSTNLRLERDTIEAVVNRHLRDFDLLDSKNSKHKTIQDILEAIGYDFKTLNNSTSITKGNSFNSFDISMVLHNPDLANYAVNTLAEEFKRYYSTTETGKSVKINHYKDLVTQKEQILEEKKELLNIVSEKNYSNLESNSKIVQDYQVKKSIINKNIEELNLQLIEVNNKIESAVTQNDEGKKSKSNTRIIELRNKINELQQLYVTSGSSNAQLKETIDNLRAELRKEINNATINKEKNSLAIEQLVDRKKTLEDKLKSEYESLNAVEQNLSQLKNYSNNFAYSQYQVTKIEEEIEEAEKSYAEVLQDYDSIKKISVKKAGIAIIPASSATMISGQNQIELVALSGLFVLFASAFFILTVEFIGYRTKTPSAFKKKTRLDFISTINTIHSRNFELNFLFKTQVLSEEYEIFKKYLRQLRQEILSCKNAKTFLITSLNNGDGKTFILLILAYSLSLIGKRILIIDTNFKHTSLTKLLLPKMESSVYMLEDQKNLLTDVSQFVVQNEDLINSSGSLISSTKHENIDVIGSKEVHDSPSEIFSGKQFDQLLRSLSYNYDYILMEGASLNHYSDTKELIPFVDKIVPVFSAESTIDQKDRESIAYLKKLNGKVTGAVLNKVELKYLEN